IRFLPYGSVSLPLRVPAVLPVLTSAGFRASVSLTCSPRVNQPTRGPLTALLPNRLEDDAGQLYIRLPQQMFNLLSLCIVPSLDPHMAEFPPYYKPTYTWKPVSSSYELRQLSFSPTVLQHTSSLYGGHISRSPPRQQPLDCSTHYSPTSNTYHCITCNKVGSLACSFSENCRIYL
ncbi:hypothetical protein XENOCAPTIV_016905, partial [Xenoophorus captivus]